MIAKQNKIPMLIVSMFILPTFPLFVRKDLLLKAGLHSICINFVHIKSFIFLFNCPLAR